MSGLEGALLAVGGAVVKSAAKIWLGDRSLAADVTTEAVDALIARTAGTMEQRRLRRLFEQLEEIVAERLEPLMAREFRAVPDHERVAAVGAVRETFGTAALTDVELFAADLDAGYVYRYLRKAVPAAAERALLSSGGTEFYERVLRECCAYLVQIVTTLPRFQAGALTEILRRETQVLALVRDVLARMPQQRDVRDFEIDYRRQVVAALDRVSFFGAAVAESSRWYPLSVAYISLGVATDDVVGEPDGGEVFGEEGVRDAGGLVRVEDLLVRGSRLFIRGEAGSGKTTLLQWIAVRCASDDLVPAPGWANVVPFFVRLRRYAAEPLPSPEQFLAEVGRHVAEEMPDGWVHEKLRSGRAVVLVDGVDELPEQRRAEARSWLRELIAVFPSARYVVTSRPAAVAPTWLRSEEFLVADLQPMTGRDVRIFVHQWHEAMRAQSYDAEERNELDGYEQRLTDAIGARQALRRLAENPLLCALMCALHRERRGQLPENRMELYEVTLHLLLERRDKDRGIAGPAELSRTEQTLLLQHIAYWLVRNGWSDAETGRVVEQVIRKLTLMAQVRASGDEVCRHLLERSGLLREAVPGRVDFVHRSFQDYLAAKAAIDADDLGLLVDNAHLDQWWEVVVMAAGHAAPQQREELLRRLVRRDGQSQHRNRRQLLGLACLETSPELSAALRTEIESRTARLLPPRGAKAAQAVAAAGDFALDLLAKTEPHHTQSVVGTIQAAARIGGPAALRIIARFGGDRRGRVIDELVRAWSRFDPVEYADVVLRDSPLFDGALNITDPALVPGLERLPDLRKLECRFGMGHGDYQFIQRLPKVRELIASDPDLTDLAPLQSCRLRFLALVPAQRAQAEPVDVAPLAEVPTLRRLDLLVPTRGWPHLAALPGLTGLQVGHVGAVERLAELRAHTDLDIAGFRHVQGLRDLTSVSFLSRPRWFGLYRCPDLVDLRELARWVSTLRRLWLRDCPNVDDLRSLTAMPDLDFLDLSGSSQANIEPLAEVPGLVTVRLTDWQSPPDLVPLRGLPRLRHLWLYNSGDVDLGPLAGREGLTVYVMRNQDVAGAELLGPGSRIERK